jgi:hypothetical protein
MASGHKPWHAHLSGSMSRAQTCIPWLPLCNQHFFTQVYRLTRQCLGFRYENLSMSGQLRGLLTWVRCHHGCVREEALRPTVLKGLYGVNTAIRLQRPDTGLTDRTHGDLSFFLASPASPAGWPPTSDDIEYSIPALQYST